MAKTDWGSVGSGTIVGTGMSVPLVIVSFFSAGFGHGTYKPMIMCFPYTMLSAEFVGLITWPAILLGLIQFPAYGALIGWSIATRRSGPLALALGAVHVAVAAIAFSMAAKSGF
jgi:hypothetical protein